MSVCQRCRITGLGIDFEQKVLENSRGIRTIVDGNKLVPIFPVLRTDLTKFIMNYWHRFRNYEGFFCFRPINNS